MMKFFLKIILLVVVMMPVWLTIVAFGETSKAEMSIVNEWKDKINSKLLSIADRRIQIIEILPPYKDLIEAKAEHFEIELSDAKPRNSSVIGLQYLDAAGRLKEYRRINCRLLIQEQAAVATRDLPRETVITAQDFKLEWRDAATFTSIVAKTNELVGKVVRNQVKENDLIFEAGLQKENLVKRGDRVKVSVVGRGLVLTTIAIAEEAGTKGQSIRLQNTDSKKEIVGVITDSREVEVRL